MRIERLLIITFLALAVAPPLGAAINVTEPNGVGDEVAEGRDFAKWELGNPWDMESQGCPDLVWDDRFECDIVETETANVTAEAFTPSGTWEGQAATNDPLFWLLLPPGVSSVPVVNGHLAQIDSSLYRHFSARVRFSGSAQAPPADQAPLVVLFAQGPNFAVDPFGQTHPALTGRVHPDAWRIISFDLFLETDPSKPSWTSHASWPGLRVDPTNEPGVDFEFDWIRLTAPGGPAQKTTIQWTASGVAGNTFAIEVVDPQGTALELVAGLPDSTTSYVVDLSALPPGSYTVRVVASPSGQSGQSCTGCLTINSAPVLHFEEPDKSGDVDNDFATMVVGDSWGPFAPGELEAASVENESFPGGVYAAQNPMGDGDPRIFMNAPVTMETRKYRMLSYKLELLGPRDIGNGSVTRFLWGNDRSYPFTSDDIAIEEGLNTYVLGDLDEVPLEGGARGAWNGTVADIRFDPHEFVASRPWYLHFVRLAPLDTADPTFQIEWSDEDPDDDASIELWYDVDRLPGNGNELPIGGAGALSEDADGLGDNFLWYPATDGVLPGRYFLFGRIADGVNSIDRYATGPLMVSCDATDYPDLDLEASDVGGTVVEHACGTIQAGPYSIASMADVSFRAGDTIVLRNGFEVALDAVFSAATDEFFGVP